MTTTIDQYAHETRQTKTKAKRDLENLGVAIQNILKAGGEVILPGVGKIVPVDKPERQGRNPSTGATIMIAAKRTPKLVPGKALRDAIN